MGFSYKFRAVPNDRDPRWFELGLVARMVACELFHAAGGHIHDDGDPIIPVAADWKVSLCRSLCIDGKDRGNVCRALEKAHAAGLIEVMPGFVRVLFRPRSEATPLAVRSLSVAGPEPLRLESSNENRSTHALQTDKTDQKEETPQTEREAEAVSTRVPASIGRSRLRAVDGGLLDFDHNGKWAHSLGVISRYPDAQWSIAATTLAQVAQDPERRKFLTPGHIVDYWHVYSAGDTPGPKGADWKEHQAASAAKTKLRIDDQLRAFRAETDIICTALKASDFKLAEETRLQREREYSALHRQLNGKTS